MDRVIKRFDKSDRLTVMSGLTWSDPQIIGAEKDSSSYRSQLNIAIMVKCHAVELFKGICNFTARGCQTRVQWHTFDLGTRPANIYTRTLFDLTKIHCVSCTTLVRNHWRFHVTD